MDQLLEEQQQSKVLIRMEKKLQEIKQQVIECTKCELSKTRNNSVAGKGNFKSDVIFVGEAPGKNEDLKGEPFIGIAGKKLSMALESAGITRDEVYITNIVKCRPPNNRVPTTNERETCKDYLKKEISKPEPKCFSLRFNDEKVSFIYKSGSLFVRDFAGLRIRRFSQQYSHRNRTNIGDIIFWQLNDKLRAVIHDIFRTGKNVAVQTVDQGVLVENSTSEVSENEHVLFNDTPSFYS